MPVISLQELQQISVDYLIVGGGTSGLALATRLSESKDVVVAVLEAGGNHLDEDEVDIPGYLGRTIANSKFDWKFFTVPQLHAAGLPILIPRGKGLGGSSAMNFMGTFRPSKDDMNSLEKLGNQGWNWDSMLQYFKKFESLCPHGYSLDEASRYAVFPDPKWHGADGPIQNSFPSILTNGHARFFDAAETLGIHRNGEMADGSNIGAMTANFSIDPKTAKRSYSASAYFAPNASRANLLVVINAQVTKILLRESTAGLQRATGVEVVCGGTKTIIHDIKRDIILSAGSIQTPQILEQSGIGNPEIIRSSGIAPVINLPGVGENLQDHVCVRCTVEVDEMIETIDVLRDPQEIGKHLALYKEGKGLLANSGAPGFLFVSRQHLGIPQEGDLWRVINNGFSTEIESKDDPSLRSGLEKQYTIQKAHLESDNLAQAEILAYLGFQPNRTNTPTPGKRYVTISSAILRPLSRGSVHICGPDPLAPPAIDPKFFSNETDMILLIESLKLSLKLLGTAPLADVVRSVVVPGEEVVSPGDDLDDRLREFIKKTCGAVYHPVGTAAMLPRGDGGVVDSKLTVYGTENLRVVDLSILPLEVGTHIQSLAYAIAEKAADMFKQERK